MTRKPVLVKVALGLAAAGAAAALWSQWRPAQAWPTAAGANVLLVTIDTLRADRLTEALMPRLGELARRGRRFATAYAHAPLTLPSHASILTGLLPPAHGVRGNGSFRLADAHVTLAERLKSAGYRTGAFVGAFVLDARFGLAQGFDAYHAVNDDRAFAADFAFAERRADAVLQDADAWLQQPSAAPWFAWIHLFDPHAPYDAPGATPAEAYDGEVRRVDTALGAFLDRLRARGTLDRTLVVVTADHGEGLGAHGESTHGLFVYDTTMRVPLVIASPGLTGAPAPTSAAPPAAHIDIVPTVLDTLGLPADPLLPGRSLRVRGGEVRPIYLEALDGSLAAGGAPARGVVESGLKFIGVPDAELYDLSRDPAEQTNLYAVADTRARALAAALSRVETGFFSSGPAPDDSADRRLRALGYAAGATRPPSRPGAADDPKRVGPLYERFLTILASGTADLDGLLQIVRDRPAFAAARLAAASVLIERGRGGDAVELLAAAASAPEASAALVERFGAACLAAGDSHRAIAVLAPLLADAGSPASADAWNLMGVARAQLGERAEARRALDTAVSLAPSAVRFRFNRALVRLEDGDRAGALDDATQIVAQAPELADAWRLRATLHYEAAQREAAIAAWQRVVQIEPADADSFFNLATAHAAAGNLAAARAAAARYLALPARPGSEADVASMRALIAQR